MVGDRLATDVAMARSFGLAAVLVLTGATKRQDIAESSIQPDYAIETLRDDLRRRRDQLCAGLNAAGLRPLVPAGTYFLYTPNLDHLSNDAENFGGLMTEVVVTP